MKTETRKEKVRGKRYDHGSLHFILLPRLNCILGATELHFCVFAFPSLEIQTRFFLWGSGLVQEHTNRVREKRVITLLRNGEKWAILPSVSHFYYSSSIHPIPSHGWASPWWHVEALVWTDRQTEAKQKHSLDSSRNSRPMEQRTCQDQRSTWILPGLVKLLFYSRHKAHSQRPYEVPFTCQRQSKHTTSILAHDSLKSREKKRSCSYVVGPTGNNKTKIKNKIKKNDATTRPHLGNIPLDVHLF